MNLLAQLNACCRRLWRDESGVVLAFTVIVFLSLFVIACSVYAVGENIRQRIELQNAADAAAYSGAVVQADALSRIAVINKALAWTYVQMGREVMDYDVDVWLSKIITQWNSDYSSMAQFVASYPSCPQTDQNSWIGEQSSGPFSSCSEKGTVNINDSQTPKFTEIVNAWKNLRFSLAQDIAVNRRAIKNMNDEEAYIKGHLQQHIQTVVLEVLTNNTGYPNPEDHLYSLISETDYFKVLNNEDILLGFFQPQSSIDDAFNEGAKEWFLLNSGSDGIQRHYVQKGSYPRSLSAEWSWYGEGWAQNGDGDCVPVAWKSGTSTVKGEGAGENYETELVKAQILNDDFFSLKGAIIVSVARAMKNPLLFMASDRLNLGLYTFFEPGGKTDTPYAWASAAARAGYKDPTAANGDKDGAYWTPQNPPGWRTTAANLSQADWDAEFVPVAWVGTNPQQLWDSPTWKKLFGGDSTGRTLGSFATGAAPEGSFLH